MLLNKKQLLLQCYEIVINVFSIATFLLVTFFKVWSMNVNEKKSLLPVIFANKSTYFLSAHQTHAALLLSFLPPPFCSIFHATVSASILIVPFALPPSGCQNIICHHPHPLSEPCLCLLVFQSLLSFIIKRLMEC